MTKNTFKYLFTILLSLVLFSLVLCFAVYGVLSVKAHGGAFAADLQRSDEPDSFTGVNDLSDRVALEREEISEDIEFEELRSEELSREVSDWQPDPNATYMFNQLVNDGNFTSLWIASDASVYSNISVNSNTLSVTLASVGSSVNNLSYRLQRSNTPRNVNTFAQHIYLYSIEVNTPHYLSFNIANNLNVAYCDNTNNSFMRVYGIFNGLDSDTNFALYPRGITVINGWTVGDTIQFRNLQLFDLTSMGLDQITSLAQFQLVFPSQYYPYTPLPGTMITPSYDAGYNDGLVDGYEQGYNAGYANGLLEINSNTFVSDRTTWRNYSSTAPFISVNGVVTLNSHRWDVGYTEMFPNGNLDYQSFSYGAKYTLASYNNQLNYTLSIDYFVFGEDPNSHAAYIGLVYEDSFIQFSLVMFEDYSDIAINILDRSGTFFYTLNNSDLYKFTVMRINDSTTIFEAGAEYADSRLNESSVSYSTGYNRGVEAANHYTFYSLIDAVILSPITMISRMLDFNILGVNMRQFFMSLLTIALVLFIFKLFLAGGGSSGGSVKS